MQIQHWIQPYHQTVYICYQMNSMFQSTVNLHQKNLCILRSKLNKIHKHVCLFKCLPLQVESKVSGSIFIYRWKTHNRSWTFHPPVLSHSALLLEGLFFPSQTESLLVSVLGWEKRVQAMQQHRDARCSLCRQVQLLSPTYSVYNIIHPHFIY